MATVSPAEFRRRLDLLCRAIPVGIARLHADSTGDAFESIVRTSPVRFGYYRAGHTIGVGSGQAPDSFLFEHPDRPPSEGPYRPRPNVIPPPDIGAARAALLGLRPFVRTIIYNSVRHAGFLEWGTALMAPRLIYERARLAVEGRMRARIAALERELAALVE